MDEKETPDSYEVGYGKPPKSTQFTKGVSGNPKGRPKKTLDFDHELIRESKSFMTVNENGRRKRISKLEVAIKQLMKQAMTGDIRAMRTFFSHYRQALEVTSLSIAQQSIDLGKCKVDDLTEEQLMRIAALGLENTEQETKKGHISNAD